MRLKLLLLLFSCNVFSNFAAVKVRENPKNIYDIKKNIKLVTKKGLILHLRKFLKAGHPGRLVGSPGHKSSQDFIIKYIGELDSKKSGKVTTHEFKPEIDKAISMYQADFDKLIKPNHKPSEPLYKKWDGFTKSMVNGIQKRSGVTGKNIIWEKRGAVNPEKMIVIGTHYDTAANDQKSLKLLTDAPMPGADNNGSGVAMALSMIEIFSKINLPVTVRIVFFDWEELGFLGSRAYVNEYFKSIKKENFLGFINLVMLGHDSKTNDKLKKYGNMNVYLRPIREDQKLASDLIARGKKITSRVKFSPIENSFNSSAHIHFWEKGLPAVIFTQDWENDFNAKRYHSPNDFAETLNTNTYYNSYLFISGAILSKLFNFKA